MNKRSDRGSSPRFGTQWVVALVLLALVMLAFLIAVHPLKAQLQAPEPATSFATMQVPPQPEDHPAVPAASEVFSGAPAPEPTEAAPSF